MRLLSHLLPNITKKALGKRGSGFGLLLNEWKTIAGPTWAEACMPEKLIFPQGRQAGATLYIRVSPSMALVLQHDTPLILERINRVFGYPAVEKIRFIHAPLAFRPAPSALSPLLDPVQQARVASTVADVKDQDLRQILEGLGQAIIRRQTKSNLK